MPFLCGWKKCQCHEPTAGPPAARLVQVVWAHFLLTRAELDVTPTFPPCFLTSIQSWADFNTRSGVRRGPSSPSHPQEVGFGAAGFKLSKWIFADSCCFLLHFFFLLSKFCCCVSEVHPAGGFLWESQHSASSFFLLRNGSAQTNCDNFLKYSLYYAFP